MTISLETPETGVGLDIGEIANRPNTTHTAEVLIRSSAPQANTTSKTTIILLVLYLVL